MAGHHHHELEGAALVAAARASLKDSGEQWTQMRATVFEALAARAAPASAYDIAEDVGCRHDCIFLICDSCGKATHFDDDALTGALAGAAKEQGFQPDRPVIELRGTCRSCSAQ